MLTYEDKFSTRKEGDEEVEVDVRVWCSVASRVWDVALTLESPGPQVDDALEILTETGWNGEAVCAS